MAAKASVSSARMLVVPAVRSRTAVSPHRIASHAVEVWQLSTAVPTKLGSVGSVTVDEVRWAFRLLFFRRRYAKEKRELLLVPTQSALRQQSPVGLRHR